MSRQTTTVTFQALELKGSLLPASLLEEVSKFNRPKELLLEPHDYGLGKGERLRDRIDAAWVLTKELWDEYTNLKERAGQSIAGQHFGHRLLKEVLGWSGVEPCSGSQQGESHYPISHRAFGGSVPLILRGIDAGDLDRGSAQFGQEGRKRSPHSCLQECLNADDSANWGLLLSGDLLRLLHDNPSLVKPAYLAADLELMIEGERFDEFSVLWLVLHASRFQHPNTGSCVLDDWKQKAEESGERVLGALRGGVQSALESLGWGFLNHPANGALREALQSGGLSRQQFHEQLLRLVYRFLFLFTAEDRDLLFPREVDKGDPRRRIYREGYSISRLRELAIKRSAYEGDYGDLWELQRLVFQQLSIGNSPLGLPGLGGLFSLEQCPDLQGAELWNGALLRAIKAIGWFDAGGTFTRVRYRDLNTEELGSVYEGLLELHPQLEQQGSQWQLSYGGGAGSDRKTTGSYYTPDALVQELIKSALVPVIDDRLSKAVGPSEQEQALLDIKVIDPACGSGHFLLAAARRLAVALAQVRAGDDQPSEDDRQHALRDVVAHCIYAVDKNPMAVELCKVALWIEAIDPGKPLSFLDAHIQCGDSLVGVFDPKVLEEGIPDEAYKPLTGDNKTVCTSLKNENAAARKTISRHGSNRGIQGSLALSSTQPRSQGQQALQAIEAMSETTLAETAAKQAAYAQWLSDRGQDPETLAADLYTAAFFLAKTSDSRATVPTTEHLLNLLAGQPVDEAMEDAVVDAAQNFRFFHWHLRFGEVMQQGGFDCILGNPPWEKINFRDEEFFKGKHNLIANAPTKFRRKQLIEGLRSIDPRCFREYEYAKRYNDSLSFYLRYAGAFPMTGKSRINMYSVFGERISSLCPTHGRAGVVIASGILTDDNNGELFWHWISNNRIIKAIDFENREKIFPAVHSSYKFCILTLGFAKIEEARGFAFYQRDPSDAGTKELVEITREEIQLLNPLTKTCPIFRSNREARLSIEIYRAVAASRTPNSTRWWGNPLTAFNISNDSGLFSKEEEITCKTIDKDGLIFLAHRNESEACRLYEAKYMWQYDHRWATASGAEEIVDVDITSKASTALGVNTRFWISKKTVEARYPCSCGWRLGYRRVSSATNQRTAVAAVIPPEGVSYTITLIEDIVARDACYFLAVFNSFIFDFLVRQKVSGADLTISIYEQLPFPPLEELKLYEDAIISAVLELTYTAQDLKHFANELGYFSDPYSFNDNRRRQLRAKIDAIVAHSYISCLPQDLLGELEVSEEQLIDLIWDDFKALSSAEIRAHGEFLSKRLCGEAWRKLFKNLS